MFKSHKRVLFPLLMLVLAPTLACSGDGSSHEAVGSTDEAILNGTTVTVAEQQARGLVSVPGGGCSGVLISNSWAFTAGHCLIAGPTNQANNSVSITSTTGTTTQTSDQIYLFGNRNAGISPDLAAIHLASPLLVNGSTTGFSNAIDSTTGSNLIGTTVAEYGLGSNQLNGTGLGTWRAANMVVSSDSGGDFSLATNLGRVALGGDSGGPYLRWVNGVQFITGIQSADSWSCPTSDPNCTLTTGDAQGITAFAVSLGDWNAYIGAVFSTAWNANLAVQAIDIRPGELAVAPWGFSSESAVGWSQAMRQASKLCYARAFQGGHFTGHTLSGNSGLFCEGSVTTYFNEPQTNINATPEPFTNIDAISSATAARDAGALCVNHGFVSGHFDGNHNAATQTYGLLCSNSQHAAYRLANGSDFAATGFPMGDVDSTSWSQAAAAAHSYCTARGYAGGYLNGQENRSNLTYGVICEI